VVAVYIELNSLTRVLEMTTPQDVLRYWFDDPDEPRARFDRWFNGGEAVDQEIRERFAPTLDAAARGELDGWAADDNGLVALVVVLDQFPRNLFRDDARAYAYDNQALDLTLQSIESGRHDRVHPLMGTFLYLPLEHCENLAIQRMSVRMFRRLVARTTGAFTSSVESALDYAERHLVIIERYGRFPHRNAVLGRTSTPDEERYLEEVARTGRIF